MASKSVTKSSDQVQALVLVEIEKEPRVDSRLLAKGLGIKHKPLMNLIRKYIDRFESKDRGKVSFQKSPSASGQGETFAYLNRRHCNFLTTLVRNSEEAVPFKDELEAKFNHYEKAYLREARQAEKRASLGWQQARVEGKVVRRIETDHIKIFVDYAIGQGSKSAKFYYANLTSMTYKALGFLELELGESLREKLNIVQHQHLMAAESIVAFALHEGMEQGLHYKAIYQVAKERVVAFAKAMPPARFFDSLNAKKLPA